MWGNYGDVGQWWRKHMPVLCLLRCRLRKRLSSFSWQTIQPETIRKFSTSPLSNFSRTIFYAVGESWIRLKTRPDRGFRKKKWSHHGDEIHSLSVLHRRNEVWHEASYMRGSGFLKDVANRTNSLQCYFQKMRDEEKKSSFSWLLWNQTKKMYAFYRFMGGTFALMACTSCDNEFQYDDACARLEPVDAFPSSEGRPWRPMRKPFPMICK